MYDGYHDDWERDDAQQIVQAQGCEGCPAFEKCEAEGVCIKHLEASEDTPGE